MIDRINREPSPDHEDSGAEVPAQHTMSRLRSGWPFAYRRVAPDYSGAPGGLGNANAGTLPMVGDAEVESDDDAPATMRGPRGRNPYIGSRVDMIPGLPSVLEPGGWGGLDLLPKDARAPVIPCQVERYGDQPTSANSGRLLDKAAGFTWRTVQVDNYSKIWLYLPAPNRYVPPYAVGAQYPVPTGSNKVEVHAASPPTITQPAANTTQVFSVTCIEDEREYSPGYLLQVLTGLP